MSTNLIRVGVIRGGPSNEYDVSLMSGRTVLQNLDSEIYHPHDIFITKDGNWHIGGIVKKPYDILSNLDVIFNAMHGEYGEDGQVQKILEQHGVPYTGSDSLSSAIGMNKILTKRAFRNSGAKTPHYIEIEIDNIDDKERLEKILFEIFRSFPMPAIVKPVSAGSSMGVSLVKSFLDLENAIKKAWLVSKDKKVMVEEYIKGVEATVGVVEDFRGENLYALPAVEIRPHSHLGKEFFDFEAKYLGKSEEIVPANFSNEIKSELADLARLAHESIGARHYSRTDFIVSPRRGIYILEINTQPGLTEESLLPKSLRAVGANIKDFLHHIVQKAIGKNS